MESGGGGRTREDCRTAATTMQSKLHGTRDELQRTAKFIAANHLLVQSAKANEKQNKTKQTHTHKKRGCGRSEI